MTVGIVWTRRTAMLTVGLLCCCACQRPSAPQQHVDELAALKDLVDAHLLADGTLSRSDEPTPRLTEATGYMAARGIIEQVATPALHRLVSDPTNYSVLVHIDGTLRKRLHPNGKTMAADPNSVAPGRITVSQYVMAFNQVAEKATPQLLSALRDPKTAAVIDAMASTQGSADSQNAKPGRPLTPEEEQAYRAAINAQAQLHVEGEALTTCMVDAPKTVAKLTALVKTAESDRRLEKQSPYETALLYRLYGAAALFGAMAEGRKPLEPHIQRSNSYFQRSLRLSRAPWGRDARVAAQSFSKMAESSEDPEFAVVMGDLMTICRLGSQDAKPQAASREP